jgi:hypothetical protein
MWGSLKRGARGGSRRFAFSPVFPWNVDKAAVALVVPVSYFEEHSVVVSARQFEKQAS